MKKKLKVGICDTYSLTYKEGIYGHYAKTARQFFDILSNDYDVVVYGGSAYKKENIEKVHILPYGVKLKDREFRIKKLIDYIGCSINIVMTLLSDCNVLIFQDCNRNLIDMLVGIWPTKKRIFFIRYSAQEFHRNRLATRAYKKIKGVITSIKSVGEFYGAEYILLPDYFPDKNHTISSLDKKYDYAVVGTITPEKLYENVIMWTKAQNKSLIIAGNFRDKLRLEQLKELSKGGNIEIRDQYLTEMEYFRIIKGAKVTILPYSNGNIPKSSGVVLDSLYSGTPVLVPNNEAFEFVKDYNVGVMYDFENISTQSTDYIQMEPICLENIERYISAMLDKKLELIKFIKGK